MPRDREDVPFTTPLSVRALVQTYGWRAPHMVHLFLGWVLLILLSIALGLAAGLSGTGVVVSSVAVPGLDAPLAFCPFLIPAYLLAFWLGAEWAAVYLFVVVGVLSRVHGVPWSLAVFLSAARALSPAVVALIYTSRQRGPDVRQPRWWAGLAMLSLSGALVGSLTVYVMGIAQDWTLQAIESRWWGQVVGDTVVGALAVGPFLLLTPRIEQARQALWGKALRLPASTQRMTLSLAFLGLVVIFSLVLIGARGRVYLEETIVAEYQAFQSALVRHGADHVRLLLSTPQRLALGLTDVLARTGLEDRAVAKAAREAEEQGRGVGADLVLLLGPDGTVRQRVGREDLSLEEGEVLLDEDIRALPVGGEWGGPLVLHAADGASAYFFTLAVPVLDPDTAAVQGVLVHLFSMPRLGSQYHFDQVFPSGTQGWLLDENGRPVSSWPMAQDGKVQPLPAGLSGWAMDLLAEPSPAPMAQSTVAGQWATLARVPLRAQSWFLLIAAPGSHEALAAMRSFYDHLTRLGVILVFTFGLLAVSAIHLYHAYRETLAGQMQARAQALTALTGASRLLAQASDQHAVLETVLDEAVSLVGRGSGAVMLVHWDQEILRIVASRGLSPEKVEAFNSLPVYVWEGTFAHVLRTGQPLEIADARTDERVLHGVGEVPEALTNLPLKVQDRVIGLISLDAVPPDDTSRQLLYGLADVAAVAIENARLLEETRQRMRELESVHRVSSQVIGSLDLERVLEGVAVAALQLVSATDVHLFLYDAEQEELTFGTALWFDGRRGEEAVITPRKDGLTYTVLRSGEPLVVHDVSTHPLYRDAPAHAEGMQAIAGFPLRRAGEVLGVMNVAFDQARTLSDHEIRALQLLADQAAIAVDNARLYEEARQRAGQLEVLEEITRAIGGTFDPAQMFRIVTERVGGLVPNDGVALARYVADEDVFILQAVSGVLEEVMGASRPLPAEEPPFGPLSSGESRWWLESLSGSGGWLERYLAAQGIQGLVSLPLRVGTQLLGALLVVTASPGGFQKDQVEDLSELTSHLALALRKAQLLEDREQALRELQETQEQLVRSEKLRALGGMAGGVAHNFNNILAVIMGRAQLAARKAGDPELRADLEAVVQAARDGAAMVRRLQDFTRMEPSTFEGQAVDLNEVIRSVVEVTRPRWKDESEREGRAVEVRVETKPVAPVAAEASGLREILTNLIFNAVDAMPDGGVLTLRSRQAGEWAEVEVEDTGVGMTEEVRRRIFDPFFTTKGPRNTGLGLSTAYGLVRRFGGTIEVESEAGRGSTFTLRLPVLRGVPSGRPAPAQEMQRERASGCILVVDDQKQVRETLGRVLAGEGYKVVMAAGGREALGKLEERLPDLMLLDLGMPDMSGWEVAEVCQQKHPGLAVILITGWGDQVDAEDARARGIQRVLAKPFDLDRLLLTVADLLAGDTEAQKGQAR